MLDKTIFAQNFTMLCEIYDKQLTKTLQSVYYAVLSDMQDEDFKQAVKRVLQERTYATLPKPAEILACSNVVEVIVDEVDEIELKAKNLISAVETMNTILCTEAHNLNITLDEHLDSYMFENICDETKAILNNVKPFCSYRELIKGVRQYQTSIDTLRAFIQALKLTDGGSLAIENSKLKQMMIKK